MNPGTQARARAARNIKQILSGRRTTDWVAAGSNQTSLSLELTYGCMRHYFSLTAQINPLLKKPLRRRDGDIYGLLLAGAYQLQRTRIPPHAALFETAAADRTAGQGLGQRAGQRHPAPIAQSAARPGAGASGLASSRKSRTNTVPMRPR